ncbi:MAG: IS630 transposase-related protein [Steroidobacteraceae bacterium]
MPRPYSQDLRERVVRAVETEASCHEVSAAFEVGPSSAIRWVARCRQSGSAAAKPIRQALAAGCSQAMAAGADCR